jgi:hypothetical protein
VLEVSSANEREPSGGSSTTDVMRERAQVFRPELAALARVADGLDTNFRRYLDGCYRKYTTSNMSGTTTGTGSSYEYGGAYGRSWFGVWEGRSSFAWQESWSGQSTTSNESTAQCRVLWSDIVDASARIRGGLDAIDDAGRRAMIYPGFMREVRREYRLSWE